MIFRWGHFADLHFAFEKHGYSTATLRSKLVTILQKERLDAILIAGDLFFKCDTSEQEKKQIADYIHRMADACGCSYDHIIPCAGNHDLPRFKARKQNIDLVIQEYKNKNCSLSTAGYDSILVNDTCENYRNFCQAVTGRTDFELRHTLIPLECANIIVLNTSIFAGQTYPGQPDPEPGLEDHNLFICDDYLADLSRQVQQAATQDRLNIILAHHGCECFAEKERYKLSNALRDMGVDLYLCGHVHQNTCRRIEGCPNTYQISCGGLFTDDNYNEPSFSIGCFDTETKQVKITAYVFAQRTGEWVPPNDFRPPWRSDGAMDFFPERLSPAPPVRGNNDLSVREKINTIANDHPDLTSYRYIKAIHDLLFSCRDKRGLCNALHEILNTDILRDTEGKLTIRDGSTYKADFTAYYALALYCKRNSQVSHTHISLKTLVADYGAVFRGSPLHLEVLSWLARRNNALKQAYDNDLALLKIIPIEVNAGVYTSFASTVAELLEREYSAREKGKSWSFWKNDFKRMEDWKRATGFMPEIISHWKAAWRSVDAYGKHNFIWGKLLLFAPDLRTSDRESISKRISEAANKFNAAIEFENTNAAGEDRRVRQYMSYKEKCDSVEAALCRQCRQPPSLEQGKSQQPYAPAQYALSSMAAMVQNQRKLAYPKPNEDVFLCDDQHGIYLIADGVTRPHSEYKSGDSAALQCAAILCQTVHTSLIQDPHGLKFHPEESLYLALTQGNKAINEWNCANPKHAVFRPSVVFLAVLIAGDNLYFYHCCDAVGYLIRGGAKIQFTEYFNWYSDTAQLDKTFVYEHLHNNKNHAAGFAIFNGDPRLQDFLQVSHLRLEPGDRVILSTDGLTQYLNAIPGRNLKELSVEKMLADSAEFDQPPFRKYADDKACIVIDIAQAGETV